MNFLSDRKMKIDDIVFKVICGSKEGTAFLISKNKALTAYHVVTEHEDEDIYLNINGCNTKVNFSLETTEEYKRLDIALLTLEENEISIGSIKFIDYSEISQGTKWSSRGYPSSKRTNGDNIIDDDRNIINQQLLTPRNNKIDLELEHCKKLSTYAGYSGAPIVINGGISGIINQELVENGESKELTGLSIKYFRSLIEKEGIKVLDKKKSIQHPLRNILNNDWFEKHIDKNILDLGPRYTPEVNIKVETSNYINATIKRNDYYTYSKRIFHNYLVSLNKIVENLLTSREHDYPDLCRNDILEIASKISISRNKIKEAYEGYIEQRELKLALKEVGICTEIINVTLINLKSIRSKHELDTSKIDEDINTLSLFMRFIENPDINTKLSNEPYLLIEGKAGTGKSHILADAANILRKNGFPSIFLLGQHFTTDKHPWSQIVNDLLRLDCSERELLECLNEIGEENNQRVLFAIDAINEGKGRLFWSETIASFVNDFKEYPWLAIVLTVRDTYISKIIPNHIRKDVSIFEVSHHGFSGSEHEAIKKFFHYYKINLPKIPKLNTEFSNPLFLKLFCEGLSKRKLTHIPEGYDGISSILRYYVDNIDTKLGSYKYYDYPSSAKVCRKILNGFIDYKIDNNLTYIPYDDACDIANKVIDRYSGKRGIVESLVNEGMLSKNLYFLENGDDDEGVYFSYERLDDHYTAELLSERKISKENLHHVFKSGGDLSFLIKRHYKYQGIIEALSILIPEKFGVELFEMVDKDHRYCHPIVNAFIYSLYWRPTSTLSNKTNSFIKHVVLKNEAFLQSFLDFLYSISGDINHPYNAEILHKHLSSIPMAERDANWTVLLVGQYRKDFGIGRLLNWIMQSDTHKQISEESLLLIAKAISWLFTTTDIELRDNATKALSILLVNRLNISISLLTSFKYIDDPYVHERILAAVYGATVNSTNRSGLTELSEYIVSEIFQQDEVYPNVLVRDYARNIVEFASFFGELHLADINVIRPPYNAALPTSFPSDAETDNYKFDYELDEFKDYYWSQNTILNSMVTEYGRGTCGYGDFGRYTFEFSFHLWTKVDANPLSNYACKLIFEKFGYNVEIHGEFDRTIPSGNRFEKSVERIGKKYQWLSMYEVVARFADNHCLKGNEETDSEYYQGPWQNSIRNIDPTNLPLAFNDETMPITLPEIEYDDWGDKDDLWLVSRENLPNPINMIAKNGYFSLESNYSWKQSEEFGIEGRNGSGQSLWYQIRSYFVKSSEYDELKAWLVGRDFMGRWMPESHESYSVFCKEHYWSPAYKDAMLKSDEPRWQPIRQDRSNFSDSSIIASVLPTAEEHRWEGSEHTSFYGPINEMFNAMNLNISSVPGGYKDNNGEFSCIDPHMFGVDRSELLVNEKLLNNYLSENNLKIIWTVLGEKQVLGSSQKSKWIDMSGVYYLENEMLFGDTKISNKHLGRMSKRNNNVNLLSQLQEVLDEELSQDTDLS